MEETLIFKALKSIGTLTNVQPPYQSTPRHLDLLQQVRDGGGSEQDWAIVDLIAPGLGACGLQATKDPESRIDQARKPILLQDNIVPEAAFAGSEAVIHMLAAGEFWARTRVYAEKWVASMEIPAVDVEFAAAPAGRRWRDGPSAMSYGQYQTSVQAVHGAVTADPDLIRRIKAYDTFPQYAFPLSLIDFGVGLAKYANTLALVDVVPAVVSVAIQRLKHAVQVPRVDHAHWSPPSSFKPVIEMPGFTAYPGGHAAIAHALAAVLSDVTGGDAQKLSALADRIGIDRQLAGLHCGEDTKAGASIGMALGTWLVEASQMPTEFPAWTVMCHRAKKEW